MATSRSILVTGAAGFVGSHLVDRLLADGYSVEAIDDLSGGSLTNLEDARRSGGMRFHQIDVRAPEFVDLVGRLSPLAIIHLAGHVDRPGSMLDPLFDADVNVLGALNVLESVRTHRIEKFALAVHGLFRRDQDGPGRLIVGQDSMAPGHISTRAAVDYVRVHGDVYGLDVRVVSLANVYGPRQSAGTLGPVVARFVAVAMEGRALELHGGGSQARDFVYVDDAADAIVRSLELAPGSIVAVGSGIATKVAVLGEMVISATASTGGTRVVPARPGDRPGMSFPTEDAARRMDWRSWTPLTEGIAATVAARRPGRRNTP